jgi:hypothetical protein
MYQKKPALKKVAKKEIHSPTLKTIKMVEDILKSLDKYTITFAGLKRKLPKKVNHNTLKEIIRYLEQSGKVYIDMEGITWIYNPSKKLARAIEEGYEWTPRRINALRKYVEKCEKRV